MKSVLFEICLYLLIANVIFTFTVGIFAQSDSSIRVKIITTDDLKTVISKANGSALLINVWATWCPPCREEFPELVKLSQNYNSEIRFIGISVDDSKDLDTKVIPFLKKENAEYENYLLKVAEPEDFINLLNTEWSGAVPATFIYDKNGKQRVVLIGKQSYDEFESAIKKVID